MTFNPYQQSYWPHSANAVYAPLGRGVYPPEPAMWSGIPQSEWGDMPGTPAYPPPARDQAMPYTFDDRPPFMSDAGDAGQSGYGHFWPGKQVTDWKAGVYPMPDAGAAGDQYDGIRVAMNAIAPWFGYESNAFDQYNWNDPATAWHAINVLRITFDECGVDWAAEAQAGRLGSLEALIGYTEFQLPRFADTVRGLFERYCPDIFETFAAPAPDEPAPTEIVRVEPTPGLEKKEEPKGLPWGWIAAGVGGAIALGVAVYYSTRPTKRRNPSRRRRRPRRRARRRSSSSSKKKKRRRNPAMMLGYLDAEGAFHEGSAPTRRRNPPRKTAKRTTKKPRPKTKTVTTTTTTRRTTRENPKRRKNLSESYRRSLPASDFAIPKRRAYPIQSQTQAKRALAFAAWPQNAKDRAAVRRAVFKRYPELRDNPAPRKVSTARAMPNPKRFVHEQIEELHALARRTGHQIGKPRRERARGPWIIDAYKGDQIALSAIGDTEAHTRTLLEQKLHGIEAKQRRQRRAPAPEMHQMPLTGTRGQLELVNPRKKKNPKASKGAARSKMITSDKRDALWRARERYDKRIRELSSDRAKVLRKVTKACHATRGRLNERTKEYRAAERARINAEIDKARAAARAACDRRRARVRATVKGAAELAKRERLERVRLADELAELRRGKARKLASAERRQTKREVQRESDDAVERNLDPELVDLWRQEKRHIKGSPRKSRTESFLEWVSENQNEVWAMREDQAARELEGLAAEQAAYYADRAPVEEAIPF
jgi:hypothetical protein